jgi:hypothetical protein
MNVSDTGRTAAIIRDEKKEIYVSGHVFMVVSP